METWRLLKDNITEPFMHFAVEEAVLRNVDEDNSPNTIRIRMLEPSTSIGIYQHPEEDIDVEYCKKNGIKIVRRINPGGAVYQDKGTFCYSAYFKKSFLKKLSVNSTTELYQIFGQAVILTCSDYGISAKISPVNDIAVNGKKIYGSAQLDWYSAFMHSGSFLINVNKEEMQRTLKPSNLKFIDKGFKNVKDRVLNLSELVSEKIDIDEFQNKFVKHLSQVLEINTKIEGLNKKELELAQDLYKTKFSNPQWTYSEKRNYSTILSTKVKSGVLILSLNLNYGVIKDISIKGDFLIASGEQIKSIENNLKNVNISKAYNIIDNSLLPEDIKKGIITLLKDIKKD